MIARLLVNKMHLSKQAGLIVLVCLSLFGCMATKNGDEMNQLTFIDQAKNFNVMSAKLGQRLSLESSRLSQAGDLKRAGIVLRNSWFSSVSFEYRITWQDQYGAELDPDAYGWTPLTLPANSLKTLQSTAPNALADHYIVHIKDKS